MLHIHDAYHNLTQNGRSFDLILLSNPSCSCTDACRSLWCQAASAVSLLINTWALWFISPPSSQVDSVHARSILTSFRRRHRRADRRTGDKSATLEGTAGPFLVALYGANQRVVKGFPFPRRPFDLLQRIIRPPTPSRDARRARALCHVRRMSGAFYTPVVASDDSPFHGANRRKWEYKEENLVRANERKRRKTSEFNPIARRD